MTTTEDAGSAPGLEERKVKVEEADLQLRREQFETDRKKGFLSNAAVMVTVIGGVSAILFQAFGLWSAQLNLQAAQVQSSHDWDFRGLELFVHDEDKLVSCDAAQTEAEVLMFQNLFPNLIERIQRVAAAKAQVCIAQQGNAAADASNSPQAAAAASDKARYAALAAFTPAISTTGAKPIVYIQISSEAQRAQANLLQQQLAAQGYGAPGVQRVASAPNQAQVRFYHSDPASQQQANAAADAVAAILHTPKPSVGMVSSHNANLPSGVVEYWFPAAAG